VEFNIFIIEQYSRNETQCFAETTETTNTKEEKTKMQIRTSPKLPITMLCKTKLSSNQSLSPQIQIVIQHLDNCRHLSSIACYNMLLYMKQGILNTHLRVG
jgi:hypothetical protein